MIFFNIKMNTNLIFLAFLAATTVGLKWLGSCLWKLGIGNLYTGPPQPMFGRQDRGLADLTSRGGPAVYTKSYANSFNKNPLALK